jgi:hypothetical protein
MGRAEKYRCLNCGEAFTPEPRNARHQRYCGLAPCKAAGKRASQAKWLAKPENRDYHRGPEAVARVQAWRVAHPGYSRHQGSAVPSEATPAIASATVRESEKSTCLLRQRSLSRSLVTLRPHRYKIS